MPIPHASLNHPKLPLGEHTAAAAIAALSVGDSHRVDSVPSRHAGLPRLATSGEMSEIIGQAERIAKTDLTTLLVGESGTGKTTIARLIHNRGSRAERPFVAINCASLPRDLIEAELFGHSRGAFTGAVSDRPGRVEMANGGTLLLDEIGDLPRELQPKLLTFLQDQTFQRIGSDQQQRVDVRVISATNQDLVQLCREKKFREDLYFRLNVLSLRVPPLRERRAAIPELVELILERISERTGEPQPRIDGPTLDLLAQQPWPGNVRELENVLERACVFRRGNLIAASDLTFDRFSDETPAVVAAPALAGKTLAEIERLALIETLDSCSGNKAKAARHLGISERSIYNKLRRHSLFP